MVFFKNICIFSPLEFIFAPLMNNWHLKYENNENMEVTLNYLNQCEAKIVRSRRKRVFLYGFYPVTSLGIYSMWLCVYSFWWSDWLLSSILQLPESQRIILQNITKKMRMTTKGKNIECLFFQVIKWNWLTTSHAWFEVLRSAWWKRVAIFLDEEAVT